MAQTALRNLYETIESKLLATEDDSSELVVSSFSWFNQNKIDSNFQALKRDVAVYFELLSIDWQTKNMYNAAHTNEEQGYCVFNLHFMRRSLKNDALSTIELIDKVNECHRDLVILGGDNFSNTQRQGEQQDNNHDNVIDWVITYSTQLHEQSSVIPRTNVNPDLIINKEIDI